MRQQRQIVLDRIGDPGVAPVEADHTRETPESLKETHRLRQRPDRLDVAGRGTAEEQVMLARAMDLVGDRNLTAARVTGLRDLHASTLSVAHFPGTGAVSAVPAMDGGRQSGAPDECSFEAREDTAALV